MVWQIAHGILIDFFYVNVKILDSVSQNFW